ncbi:MAG: RDD family protein [Actinomycetes bacterium]
MTKLPDTHPRPTQADDFPAHGPNSLASIGERGVGRTIDLLLELIPVVILVVPYLRVEGNQFKLDSIPFWMGFVTIGVAVVYETTFIAWRGQTIGKMIVGVRVAQLVGGQKLDLSQAGLRSLVPSSAWAIPVLGFGLYLMVFLSAIGKPLRRGIHDRGAGSVVVRTR